MFRTKSRLYGTGAFDDTGNYEALGVAEYLIDRLAVDLG